MARSFLVSFVDIEGSIFVMMMADVSVLQLQRRNSFQFVSSWR